MVVSGVGAGAALVAYARLVEIPGIQARMLGEAKRIAAALEKDRPGPLLRRLASPGQLCVPRGELGSVTASHPWAAEIAGSRGDPLTPVIVLSSDELPAFSALSAKLLDLAEMDQASRSWAGIRVFRARNAFTLPATYEPQATLVADYDTPGEVVGRMEEALTGGKALGSGVYIAWGERWVSGWAPLTDPAGTAGVVEVGFNVEGIYEAQRFGVGALCGEAVLVLLVGIPLLVRALRPLAGRLGAFERGIEAVKAGRFDVSLPAGGDDELDRLAAAFNAMTAQLFGQERMRSVLEQTMSPEVAQAMLAGGPELSGDEHEATVLFADVRGFTSLSEGLSAREVIRLLNDWFARAAPAVEKRGGFVDKFLGDGLLAVFGPPARMENDALAAVEAALAMRAALAELNASRAAEGKPPFEVGIGINTGPVVTGTLGSAERKNFTVLGSAVNLASRLCSKAAPGQIVISETTWLRVRTKVDAKELEALTLKGVTFPVRAFEVREKKA